MTPAAWRGHPEAWTRVARAILMLRIGGALLLAIAVIFVGMCLSGGGRDVGFTVLTVLVCLYAVASTIVEEVVAHGMRHRRSWAWLGGLICMGMDCGNLLFVPFAVAGLIALGDPRVRRAFEAPPEGKADAPGDGDRARIHQLLAEEEDRTAR